MKKLKTKHKQSQAPSRRGNKVRTSGEPVHQFRRGRTLTGSSSLKISSSNEYNSDMLSPRALTHYLSAHRRRIVWRLVAVVIAALAVYVFTGQLIATATISSTSASIPTKLENEYSASLDRYLKLYPTQRFKPALHSDSMLDALQQQHPEIETATLNLTGKFGEAQLKVQLRRPIARWNLNGMDEYVDQYGVVFAYNAFDAPELQIIDKTGISPTSGGLVTSKRFLGFVGLVVGGLSEKGYHVTQATIPALTTRQLTITIREVSYSFKLNVDRSAGEQIEDIVRIIPFLKSKGSLPVYVDVRIKGKAFYK